MATNPKKRTLNNITSVDPTGAKHRVREADELRSNKSAQQTAGAQRSQ